MSYVRRECERCCGSDCWAEDMQDTLGECWGPVEVIDEDPIGDDDYCWVHGCSGHEDRFGKYQPKPDGEVAP